MESEAQPHAVKQPTNNPFRPRVLRSDGAHYPAARRVYGFFREQRQA